MKKPRFRIVEDREVSARDGSLGAKPVFYIEERENFLFFSVWNRWMSNFSTEENAREMVKALNESRDFKAKILQ